MDQSMPEQQTQEEQTERPSLGKRFLREVFKILVGVALGLAIMVGLIYGVPVGLNWKAEKNATAYCESVKRGADVNALVAGFDKNGGEQRILQYEAEDGSSHTFLFEGFMFDKAACRVVIDKDRKAVSTQIIVSQ